MKKYILIILSLSIFMHLNGQTVNGTILDAKTNKVIPFATVYYDQSITGTSADINGDFEIGFSKDSKVPLIVSAIGYYSFAFSKYFENENKIIYLKPKVYEISETVIHGKALAEKRARYLRLFEREFIGATKNSLECEILNKEDITFNYKSDSDTVKAYASKPIIIENKALGYRITYFLDKFEHCRASGSTYRLGSSVFAEIQTEKKARIRKCKRKRETTYYGSRMHFIRVLYSDYLEESDFTVKIKPNNILTTSDFVFSNDKQQKILKNIGKLGVSYNNRGTAVWFMKDSVYINETGFFNPAGISWEYDMALDRVADMLPLEYNPEGCPYLGKPKVANNREVQTVIRGHFTFTGKQSNKQIMDRVNKEVMKSR